MRDYNTDYSGRQVDIEWLQSITRPRTDPTQLAFSFTSNTKIVTGLQRLAQRFTLTFLTNLQDIQFDQTFGTTFWRDLYRGAAQNIGRVAVAVNRAMLAALAQMQAEDVDTDTYGDMEPDDQISRATLVNYAIDRTTGTLNIEISIQSQAGTSYTYVLPVQAVRT